jgi:hypothetical protein
MSIETPQDVDSLHRKNDKTTLHNHFYTKLHLINNYHSIFHSQTFPKHSQTPKMQPTTRTLIVALCMFAASVNAYPMRQMCGQGRFQCATNELACIDLEWKCDGWADCPDESVICHFWIMYFNFY